MVLEINIPDHALEGFFYGVFEDGWGRGMIPTNWMSAVWMESWREILLVVVLQKSLPRTDWISKNCVLEYVWSFYIWIPEPCLRGLWNMRVTQCFLITEGLKTGDTSSQWKDPHFWTKQTVEMVNIFAVRHSPVCSFEIPEKYQLLFVWFWVCRLP